jgi:hypothetical protein
MYDGHHYSLRWLKFRKEKEQAIREYTEARHRIICFKRFIIRLKLLQYLHNFDR